MVLLTPSQPILFDHIQSNLQVPTFTYHYPTSSHETSNCENQKKKKKTQNPAIQKKKKNHHPSQQLYPATIKHQSNQYKTNQEKNKKKKGGGGRGDNLRHCSEWIQHTPCLFPHLSSTTQKDRGRGGRGRSRSKEGDGAGNLGWRRREGTMGRSREGMRRCQYQDSAPFRSFPRRLRGAEPKPSRRP